MASVPFVTGKDFITSDLRKKNAATAVTKMTRDVPMRNLEAFDMNAVQMRLFMIQYKKNPVPKTRGGIIYPFENPIPIT